MPEFRFNGLGSGLDVQQIVEAIRNAEIAPAESRLNRLKEASENEISSLGKLQSALQKFTDTADALNDADLFQSRKANLPSNDYFSASTRDGAQLGSYEIEVRQLATTTKIATVATQKGAAIGEGTINLTVGDQALSVDIEPDGSTLADIRDAINNHEDNDFVDAAIINDDDGERLVLTTKNTGENEHIAITVDDADGNDSNRRGLSRLVFNSKEPEPGRGKVLQSGQDAELSIDGLVVTRSSNSIDDAIDGVTLTVKAEPENPDDAEPYDLRVENNESKVRSAIKSMVDAYNSLRSVINRETNVVQVEGSENIVGTLVGDSTVRGLERSLDRILQAPLGDGATLGSLIDIGVERNGDRGSRDKLELDDERLDAALENNFSALAELFVGEQGFSGQLDAQVGALEGSSGILARRTDNLQATRKDANEQLAALELREARVEARLYAQYQAMDSQVAQYNNTISFIEAALMPRNNDN